MAKLSFRHVMSLLGAIKCVLFSALEHSYIILGKGKRIIEIIQCVLWFYVFQ